jgi:hypothetical protein
LVTKDIQGTKPNVLKDAISTKRHTDPLVPLYKLPYVEYNPPTPPKFIKDSMEIDVSDGIIE